MASILTTDVQTYVRELIAKEFGSVFKEKEALSENKESTHTRSRTTPPKQWKGRSIFPRT